MPDFSIGGGWRPSALAFSENGLNWPDDSGVGAEQTPEPQPTDAEPAPSADPFARLGPAPFLQSYVPPPPAPDNGADAQEFGADVWQVDSRPDSVNPLDVLFNGGLQLGSPSGFGPIPDDTTTIEFSDGSTGQILTDQLGGFVQQAQVQGYTLGYDAGSNTLADTTDYSPLPGGLVATPIEITPYAADLAPSPAISPLNNTVPDVGLDGGAGVSPTATYIDLGPGLIDVVNYARGVGPNYVNAGQPTFGSNPTWGKPNDFFDSGRINTSSFGDARKALSDLDYLVQLNGGASIEGDGMKLVLGNEVPGWSTDMRPGQLVNTNLQTGLSLRLGVGGVRIDILSGSKIAPGIVYSAGVPETVHCGH